MAKRKSRLPLILFILLLVVPTIELAIVMAVGSRIGVWPTVGLLVAESLLGAWIVKREGRSAWRALRGALQSGNMPSGELADAALVLVGGTLLLTPGFLTDAVGFFCVLPFTRVIARGVLTKVVESNLLRGSVVTTNFGSSGFHTMNYPPHAGAPSGGFQPGHDPNIVTGEVIEPDEPPRPRP